MFDIASRYLTSAPTRTYGTPRPASRSFWSDEPGQSVATTPGRQLADQSRIPLSARRDGVPQEMTRSNLGK